jgi:predicted PhzF superfamily epimerase YddE/YHI9
VTAAGDGTHDFVSIPEDPVTGGAHTFSAYQASRRGGELTCRLAGDRVQLHGSCVFYLDGHIEL